MSSNVRPLMLAVGEVHVAAVHVCEERDWEIIGYGDGIDIRLFVVLLPECSVEHLGRQPGGCEAIVIMPTAAGAPKFLLLQAVDVEQTKLFLLP